jgi:hypothetical protein
LPTPPNIGGGDVTSTGNFTLDFNSVFDNKLKPYGTVMSFKLALTKASDIHIGSFSFGTVSQCAAAPQGCASNPLCNPALPVRPDSTLKWGKLAVTLYGASNQPIPGDINQADIGDCDLLSGLASLAAHDPDVITKLIVSSANDTFVVAMIDPQGNAVSIVIDNEFVLSSSGDLAQVGDLKTPNWATVLEKAAAKYNYIYTAASGTKGNGFAGLEGAGPENLIPMFIADTTTYACEPGQKTADDMLYLLNLEFAAGSVVTCGSAVNQTWNDGPIVHSHGYAALGVSSDNATVQARNPWGTGETDKGSSIQPPSGGISNVPIADFARDWDIRVVRTKPLSFKATGTSLLLSLVDR